MDTVPGWGNVAERERLKREVELGKIESPEPIDNEELIEFERRRLIAPIEAVELLKDIRFLLLQLVNEMKMANSMVAGAEYTPFELDEPEETVVPEADEYDMPVPEIPEGKPTPPKPELESEAQVVEYLQGILRDFKDGDYHLEESKVEEFDFGVEKDKVIMKAPWIGKEHFWAFVSHVEKEMNGKYDKPNQQFVLPRP